jgi:hypothetical protein
MQITTTTTTSPQLQTTTAAATTTTNLNKDTKNIRKKYEKISK